MAGELRWRTALWLAFAALVAGMTAGSSLQWRADHLHPTASSVNDWHKASKGK